MPPPYGPLGRYLAAKKQRKQDSKTVREEAQRLEPVIRQRLDDTQLALSTTRDGARKQRLVNLHTQYTQRLGNPPGGTVEAASHWTKLGLDSTELLAEAQRSASVSTALRERCEAPLQRLRMAVGTAPSPVPTGMAAELQRITELAEGVDGAWARDDLTAAENQAGDVGRACQAANEVVGLWVPLLTGLGTLERGIARLPYKALKRDPESQVLLIRQALAGLEPLDVGAKRNLLAAQEQQRIQAELALRTAERMGITVTAVDTPLGVAISEAETALSVLAGKPEAAKARAPLRTRLDSLREGRNTAATSTDPQVLTTIVPMGPTMTVLAQDIAALERALQHQKTLSTDPGLSLHEALRLTTPAVRMTMAQDIAWVKTLQAQVQAKVDAARWGEVEAAARTVQTECNALTQRITALQNIEALPDGLPKLRAKMDNVLVRARGTLSAMRNHVDHPTAFATLDTDSNLGLNPHIVYDTYLLSKTPPATQTELDTYLPRLIAAERKARLALAAYDTYKDLRTEIGKLLVELRNHPQNAHLQTELTNISNARDQAHLQGPTAGWSRARVMLQPLLAQCKDLQALAEKLALQASQLPTITQAVNERGLEPRFATAALKILAEEGCSVEQAVAMAESASIFETEGLSELDAIVSARTENGLMTGDGAVSQERAHAICKLVRARGSANIDDVKAVAEQLKRVPTGAINAFNAQGIENVIFRGGVTEVQPENHDVLPRGWPLDKTWDDCPGMGSATAIYVGTMDDGVDSSGRPKRKIPGPGEGPVQHGTDDLLGHEAGHTFDSMGGGTRRTEQAFVQARTEVLNLTGEERLLPGRDNYFMTTAETVSLPESARAIQTEDGALSETFAESFALHCQGNTTRWPNLMTFWANYTW